MVGKKRDCPGRLTELAASRRLLSNRDLGAGGPRRPFSGQVLTSYCILQYIHFVRGCVIEWAV